MPLLTNVLLRFLLGFLGIASLADAQSYSETERRQIAQNARRLIQDKYLTNMEILTHYEADQPYEALQNHIDGLLRDAFRTHDALVFNEFRNLSTANTTLGEYIKDCRIFSAGKPVINTLNFDEARYDIKQTKDGSPFVNVYLDKQLQGIDKKGKPFRFQNLTEFRVLFVFDKRLTAYHTFKIAGISKVGTWPATAFTITERPEPVKSGPNDLPSALATLVNQLKTGVPANVRQLTLETFTYNRCGVNTPLSDRIFATLSNCLHKQVIVDVASPTQRPDNTLTVRGFYTEDGPNLRLVAELYDPRTNQVLTSADHAGLPLSWLTQQNLQLKPANYQQVAAIRDTLQQFVSPLSASLTINIRTNRGRQSVEFWQGNQMTIEVKASSPCHLRLVYLLADGAKTLLENDFEVKPGQENQYIRVAPETLFICSEPFGTEHLLAYAAEEPFCPIPTKPNQTLYVRNESGYWLLIGSLRNMITAVSCTKGQKQVAEDRIQITTRKLPVSR